MKTNFHPKHFLWQVDGKVATITLDRPDCKNPLTFDAYAKLRDLFRAPHLDTDIKVVVAAGPTFAHGMTKTMLRQEWAMGVDEAIEAEAQAQAICMQTQDFRRSYEAFANKRKPAFEGN